MERIGTERGLLTRKAAAVLVLAALFFAASAACLSTAAYAIDFGSFMEDHEVMRFASDFKLGAVLAMIEIAYAKKNNFINEMEDTYKLNHAGDHRQLSIDPNAVVPLPVDSMSVYEPMGQPGADYRGAAPTIYSTRYKDREAAFREAMGGAAEANRSVAGKIIDDMDERIDLIKRMELASQNADGYLALIQGGTQEANYLNIELVELRSDTMRQADIQMRAAMEEAQDDFDNTSAFEGAVNTWKNQPATGGY